MAHTIDEIQEIILSKISTSSELSALEVLTDDEKAALPNLTSTSKVSVWRLFVFCIAAAWLVFEMLLDAFYALIEALVSKNRPHSLEWYKSRALAFQYGDPLNANDEYDVIDPAKQIIKQVACVEGDRTITFKIATLNGTDLVKLSDSNQVDAFTAYMKKMRDGGTRIDIVNEDADLLKVDMDFYYDALLVKNDGTTILTNINVVEKAINDYLKSLDFNGEFDLNKMTDYLQKATGYKSLKLNYVGFKAALASTYTEITRIYQPLSGYMKLDLPELNVNYYASL